MNHASSFVCVDSFFDTLLPEPVQPPPPAQPPRARPLTAVDVREKMVEIIDALRTAKDEVPFDAKMWKQHKAMFPIMAQWLDPEDGAMLVAEFRASAARFE